jgi:hypothetical protein
MNNPIRQFWFRHYWWIVVVLLGMAISAVLLSGTKDALGLIATLVGVALTVIYFVQKQKLEEFQLFEKLFTQFNRRYDELNDKLENVRACRTKSDVETCNTLNDYFNLCAEEYLFYSEGRIHPSAWRAWCRGMKCHLESKHVRPHWDREIKSGSYYGLTWEVIEKSAEPPE